MLPKTLTTTILRLVTITTKITSTSFVTMSSTEIKAAKAVLRKQIDAKVAALSASEIWRQSDQLHQHLYRHPKFIEAKRVGLYLSMPQEADTIEILRKCFELGKQCFVPRFHPKGRQMDFVQVTSFADYETLPIEPKYKIRQPNLDDTTRADALETGGLDLLITPSVAYTINGLRLGHGKGYFDTYIRKVRDIPNIQHPFTVGLALKEQIVDNLPVHEWDVPIDEIIIPDD